MKMDYYLKICNKGLLLVVVRCCRSKQDILTRDFSRRNSDAMDILTLGLGLGLGRVLGLELGHQDAPGLKNTRVNFFASGRSHQDVADPCRQGLLCTTCSCWY